MLRIVFVLTAVLWFTFGHLEYTNVFTCSNLLDDVNYTVGMFLIVENKKQLTISEKYFMANLSCSTVTMAKKELNEDLCALEMDPLILDRRNSLENYIDEKISIFCDHDFNEIQSKCNLFLFIKKYFLLLDQYWKDCNESLRRKGTDCVKSGANRVKGMLTEDYIMKQIGNVREINLTLNEQEIVRSCCAIVYIRNCIEDLYLWNCSLMKVTEYQFNDSKKFFDNAVSLFGCSEEQCSGSFLQSGYIFWLAIIIVALWK